MIEHGIPTPKSFMNFLCAVESGGFHLVSIISFRFDILVICNVLGSIIFVISFDTYLASSSKIHNW